MGQYGLTYAVTFVQESGDLTDGGTSDTGSQPQEKTKVAPENVMESIPNDFSTLTQIPFAHAVQASDAVTKLHHRLGSSGVASVTSIADSRHYSSSSAVSPPGISGVSPLPPMSPWAGVTPPLSPPNTRTVSDLQLSAREAALLRLFIHKIAPWADICDLQSHFSTEVPRRAIQVPMVLKALLSLSARLDAIMSNTSDWEASEYHGQCLELLIAALARPEETYDANLLITVVILRIYEELKRPSDEQCHFFGSNRLLNRMSTAASSGGITEAVSWQFLRQAIYASIVQFQPMQLDLTNYERSSVFQRRDDAAYANTIIFLCAKIIQLYPKSHSCVVDEAEWRHLMNSVEQWYQSRPVNWQPLQYKEAEPDADRPFPESWIMSPSAVVGLQYYHTCRILLTLSDRHWGISSDYELARLRRLEEKTVASHIVQVIGLSMSNETVENAYFMACHLLHRYGYTLRHPAEHRGSLRFLERVEKAIGWRTAEMVHELESRWSELSALDSRRDYD
ncbi:conserved hypothetical protein [Aspergillus terreus NIH2624]|uniref:Zn(II)2Cys6 transcription factor n=1 Tax=Aspergillus terreus (strain NIH 2624 / FGSC A1156) TaxID=341663 RepID=Q0CK43_ASPTN|nr:uncharacterized protein ATEG_05941 [Aspergillus terreus NIH2624]EAU33702.1 conserved hypothetical protein [Aspergillus terreus NIH2624]